MMALLVESALRACVLAVLVATIILTLRVRDLHLQRSAWIMVLAASLLMPLLMKIQLLTPPPLLTEWLQAIEFSAAAPTSAGFDWSMTLFGIYLAVAWVLLARQAIGQLRLWRRKSRAPRWPGPIADAIDVRVDANIHSPVTAFSTVLLPAEFAAWPRQKQAAVMAHEVAHIVHRDFYIQALAQLHRAVFWFSPLAWWLPRRLSLLSEHLSDQAAIETLNDRTAYAEILLSLVRGAGKPPHAAVAMANGRRVFHRIDRILTEQEMSHPSPTRRYVLIAALLPLVGVAAGLQASARGLAEEPTTSSAIVLPKSNPTLPLSQPVYPAPARARGEKGTVVLRLHVMTDGSVGDATVYQSSGFPMLDQAALFESYRWRLDPGTNNGKPEPMWGRFAVTFKDAKK